MKEYLDRRYALALYQLASEQNKVDEIISQFKQVCDLLDENKKLKEIIEHPQISSKEKKDIIKKVFNDNIDKDLLGFLDLLIDKDRIEGLRAKFEQVEEVMLEKSNKIKATVKSCIKLSDEQRKLLIEKLENKYKKTIILEETIDTSIIGGIYLKIGNDVIDGTLAHQYDEMESQILNKR